MKTSKQNVWTVCVAAIVMIMFASQGQLFGQTAAVKSGETSGSETQWCVKVERVDSANFDLASSFQVAIYENLLEELNKTRQFKQVFRDGDLKATETSNLLVLKTTVVKYTPGSETRRAVTTISGATKLKVRSELLTPDGKVVFERAVNGDVRFFGSNLRATHNLARNIAKALKKSSWSAPEQPSSLDAGQL